MDARPLLENSTACQKSMPIVIVDNAMGEPVRARPALDGDMARRMRQHLIEARLTVLRGHFVLSVNPCASAGYQKTSNGEFDPGSGRTLAACLTHASRTVISVLAPGDQWRTGE